MKNKTLRNQIFMTLLLIFSGFLIALSSLGIVMFIDHDVYIEGPEVIIQDFVEGALMDDFYEIYNQGYVYDDDGNQNQNLNTEAIEQYLESHFKNKNLIFTITNQDETVLSFNGDEKALYPLKTYQEKADLKIHYGVMQSLKHQDKYVRVINLINQALVFKYWVFPIFLVSIVGFVSAFWFLLKNKKEPVLKLIDKIPLELLLLAYFFGFIIVADVFYSDGFVVFIYSVFTFATLMPSLNRRHNLNILTSNSLTAHLMAFIKKSTKNFPVFIKGLGLFGLIFGVEFWALVQFQYDLFFIILILLFVNGMLAYLYIRHFSDLKMLEIRSAEIVSKDLKPQWVDASFLGLLDPLAKNLNDISVATKSAVEKEMQSERMKTELITNVSHDIKTPITSIINYVALLNETEDNTKIKEYLEVLNRQSARLKHLVEDLIEASKLSTGNITLQKEPTDLNVLFEQLTGELSDKFEEKGLEIILDSKVASLITPADGKLLSRLFDNILSNAYAYSLENTRVYITLDANHSYNIITIKNISKDALNMDVETLMERFMRADSSRNTEGSGLGLSIAESIVTLHDGQFKIDVDGDLFKVAIYLRRDK